MKPICLQIMRWVVFGFLLLYGLARADADLVSQSVNVLVSSTPIQVLASATAPAAPTIGTATAGNAQATISFTPPTNTGGSAITSYRVVSTPGQFSATGTASPLTVTGLTNGTAYTFAAYAINAIGTSPASTASNSVTPATVPSAPVIGAATAGNAQATVNFTLSTNNGGSVITSYTAKSNTGITANGSNTPIVVTGLTNGTAYTFTVTANNAQGASAPSAASNSVTPASTGVPNSPTMVLAAGGNAQATISFVAPSNNGGSAITGYTITATHAAGTLSKTATTSPFIFTGLTNGTAYTFKVAATNVNGTGAASTASNSVTPAATGTVPAAPTIGTATSGSTQASVAFTAPTNTGGYPITHYRVISTPSNLTSDGTTSPITIAGLTNGVAYTFKVIAFNSLGASPTSAASNSVIPATVPSAPSLGKISAGNTQATINFTPPTSNGGSVITNYTITATHTSGTLNRNTTASPFVFTGLTNGVAYTFKITATNVKGTGPASATSASITPSATAVGIKKVYFIHTDHLKTPRVITDKAGAQVWRRDNTDPFGDNRPTVETIKHNLGFPGQYFDKETGLYYNWNRFYNGKIGRYGQSDPIGLDGGLNTYGYVGGDPLGFVDPQGLYKCQCIVLGDQPGGTGLDQRYRPSKTNSRGAPYFVKTFRYSCTCECKG